MRTAFEHLVDALDLKTLIDEETRGAAGRHQRKAVLGEDADGLHHHFLVLIFDRDEHRARAGQIDAGAELALGESKRIIGVEAHDLAGRAHFRAEQGVDAGEAGEREDGFLDRDMLERLVVRHIAVGGECRCELFAGHDAGRDLGDRRADGLGDEGHGTRGARIDLQHIDGAVLDGELHIHQTADIERLGHRAGLLFKFRHDLVGERVDRK